MLLFNSYMPTTNLQAAKKLLRWTKVTFKTWIITLQSSVYLNLTAPGRYLEYYEANTFPNLPIWRFSVAGLSLWTHNMTHISLRWGRSLNMRTNSNVYLIYIYIYINIHVNAKQNKTNILGNMHMLFTSKWVRTCQEFDIEECLIIMTHVVDRSKFLDSWSLI